MPGSYSCTKSVSHQCKNKGDNEGEEDRNESGNESENKGGNEDMIKGKGGVPTIYFISDGSLSKLHLKSRFSAVHISTQNNYLNPIIFPK